MNSRQRRQFKRRWKYIVKIDQLWRDEEDESLIEWAHRNFGYYNYYLDLIDGEYAFRFHDKEKAMQFALRWSGS